MDTVDLTSDDPVGPGATADADDPNGAVSELEQQLQLVDEELLDVEESLEALRSRQLELRKVKEELTRQIATERRAPRADWQNASFAWDAQVQLALSETFGLQQFRPLQREVINATLAGRDVLCLMPSGGGKSLCYQLPALVSSGVTLVVLPLLSLIVDQVMGLQGRVQAYGMTSLSTKEEAAAVMAALTSAAASTPKASSKGKAAAGEPQQPILLYCTPEKIVASKRLMSKLEKLYQAGKLARVAIDECHCCSTWGNDFRPDYKKLGILKQQFPETPIIALTATATSQVAKDVTNILGISGAEQFSASINRPNLHYSVVRKSSSDDFEQLRGWIADNYGGPDEQGIVYCLTRKDCEVLAEKLNTAGITATHYHADMEPRARATAHSAWSEGQIKVVVATISFGMGINKANVRFVIHACLAKSLENYYQESGRAGRDLQPAQCVLFYRLADALRQASVVCFDHGWARHLNSVMRYAAATQGCRRATLAAHFAEPPPTCNNTCDLCVAAAEAAAAAAATDGAGGGSSAPPQQQQQPRQQDLTEPAQLVVKLLQERKGEKRATLNQLLDDMHKASKKAASSSSGSSNGGVLTSRNEHEWLVQEMLLQNLLSLDFGFTAYNTNTYLVAGPSASMLGRQRLLCVRPSWLAEGAQQPSQPPPSQQPQPPKSRKRAATSQQQPRGAAAPPKHNNKQQQHVSIDSSGDEDDDDAFM